MEEGKRMTDIQCGNYDPHMSHDYTLDEYGDVTCSGVSERHCTLKFGHGAHPFDEAGFRYWCEGTVAEPTPEPEYDERYCNFPGGCGVPGHLYVNNDVTYVCPGGNE
jgi:hypothetical protein